MFKNSFLKFSTLLGSCLGLFASGELYAATITLSGASGNSCTYTSIAPGSGAGDLSVSCAVANVCTLTASPNSVNTGTGGTVNVSATNCSGAVTYTPNNSNLSSGTVTNGSFSIPAFAPAGTIYTIASGNTTTTVNVNANSNASQAPSGCTISQSATSVTSGSSVVFTAGCTGGAAATSITWTLGSGLSATSGMGTHQVTATASATSSTTATVTMVVSNSFGSAPTATASVNITPNTSTPGCNAQPSNTDVVNLDIYYSTFSKNLDSFIGSNRIFAGRFTYMPNTNALQNAILSIEQGNLGQYGIEKKDIYISKCPGSFLASDTPGSACYDSVSVGSFWIDSVQNQQAPYYCHLTPGTVYYVNMKVQNSNTSSFLLGFIRY